MPLAATPGAELRCLQCRQGPHPSVVTLPLLLQPHKIYPIEGSGSTQ